MTNEQALQLMRSATSVKDWNSKRLKVQTSCTQAQWEELHKHIDAYGLIVEVLGQDPPKYLQAVQEEEIEVLTEEVNN